MREGYDFMDLLSAPGIDECIADTARERGERAVIRQQAREYGLDACVVEQANLIKENLKDTYQLINRVRDRIETLKLSAGGARAIRYDKERTFGGTPYTMADQVMDYLQLEDELKGYQRQYSIAYLDFYQIMFDAGFDVDQVTLYPKRLLQDWSLGRLANWYHIPKWRVQYLLEKADKQFAQAVGKIIDGADYN